MIDDSENYSNAADGFPMGDWIIGAVDAHRNPEPWGRSSETDPKKASAEEFKAFEQLIHQAVGASATGSLGSLKKLSQARWKGKNAKLGGIVKNLSRVANNVLTTAGRNEADRLDRPNIFCCIFGTSVAPSGTLAFSITPGNGNSYYRVLGFTADDTMAGVFGFTSLKVGGQEHVQMSQTTPTAPVTSACSWNIFQLRESRLRTNISPWSGQFFDGTVPITGTIANMTVAATANAVTLAPVLTVLAQSDPCAYNTSKVKEGAARYWNAMGKGLGGVIGVGLSSR